jgi:hypothetical protein
MNNRGSFATRSKNGEVMKALVEHISKSPQGLEYQPGVLTSRGSTGEVIAPLHLPPELDRLSRDWEELTYDQKVEDVKKRSLEDRLRLFQTMGVVYKNATQVVREFFPLVMVLRDEFSQPGRRIPIQGRPTWTEFVRSTFGFSVRYMQQLLGASNPTKAKPRVGYSKRLEGPVQPKDDGAGEEIAALAVRLATRLLEQGLAEQFPEVAEILKLANVKTWSSTPDVAASRSAALHLEPERVSLLRITEQSSDVKRPEPEDGILGPQPDCFICETGIHTCPMHEPQLRALMAATGKDDHDASLILRDQFARLRRLGAGC